MMNRERLKAALTTAERKGPGRGFPKDLKREVVAYCDERRRAGAGWGRVAEELGLCRATLERWAADGKRPAFSAVEIVQVAPRESVIVSGPRGLRVEGLDLDGVVELWRRLV
jgi:hypothetical protein